MAVVEAGSIPRCNSIALRLNRFLVGCHMKADEALLCIGSRFTWVLILDILSAIIQHHASPARRVIS
jgi:hypothetical protein